MLRQIPRPTEQQRVSQNTFGNSKIKMSNTLYPSGSLPWRQLLIQLQKCVVFASLRNTSSYIYLVLRFDKISESSPPLYQPGRPARSGLNSPHWTTCCCCCCYSLSFCCCCCFYLSFCYCCCCFYLLLLLLLSILLLLLLLESLQFQFHKISAS